MIKSTIITVCIFLILMSCGHSQKDIKSIAGSQERVFDAFILKAEKKPIEISLPAEIKPIESAKIFSKVNGFIKNLNVDIGSVVRKGELLAVIEAPELKAQLAEAKYKEEAAKAKYLSNKDTYDRIKLSAETPGVISYNDIEKTKNQMLVDSANYSAARYYLNSIIDLNNYLLITSPFDGIITVRNLNIGDIVGINAPHPIFEIENNRTLRIRVAIPESLAGTGLVNNEVKFFVSAYPGVEFMAHFARKSGSIDVNTRSEAWEFETSNTSNRLQGGMYAELKLKISRVEASFFVPKASVVTTLEKSFAIRVKDGLTQWIDVSKGNTVPDKVEIFGNLQENDTILANANEEIRAGQKIKFKLSTSL